MWCSIPVTETRLWRKSPPGQEAFPAERPCLPAAEVKEDEERLSTSTETNYIILKTEESKLFLFHSFCPLSLDYIQWHK